MQTKFEYQFSQPVIPAIFTRNISPHPLLQPYVRCYAIRKFDTNGADFLKPIYAEHETRLTFFIRSKLGGFEATNKENPAFAANKNGVPECPLEGIHTFTKGFAVFNGATLLLTVHFKLTGVFRIFKIRPGELFDKVYTATDVLPGEVKILQEQLHETDSLAAIVYLIDAFLLKNLAAQKPVHKNGGIVKASFFLDNNLAYNIKRLAADCNMTLQTFEVNFNEQTGISPKQYLCLKRFNSAVNLRLLNPFKSWTDIAYSSGYYDQAHLIKEFREYTSLPPQKFMKIIHPPFENFE